MGKKHNVFINGRSVVTEASDGTAMGMPNVCKTPVPAAPPVPVPYPSVGKSDDLVGASKSVLVGGSPVFTSKSKIKSSKSDEPGSAGGIISGTRGGEVKSTTHSMNVLIHGGYAVRDLDLTVQNAGNAVGFVSQSQAPPAPSPTPAKQAESVKMCAFCEQKDHKVTRADPPGQHLRTKRSRSIANRIRRAWPAYGKTWAEHPWAVGKLQGHHLIDCAALKENPFWQGYCLQSGYDVNHRHNGVMLPSEPDFACALGVPQHLGNHDRGWIYDEEYKQIGPNGKIINTTISAGKKRPHQAPHLAPLAYPAAVKQKISIMRDQAQDGGYCLNPSNFTRDMDTASHEILMKLASFFWTLRADGINLRPGGKGCRKEVLGDQCRKPPNFSGQGAHKSFSQILRKKLQIGS